jgi:D-3-phosphoglycerate dehydrogenase / 2-oxoglutarate reductase
MAPKVLISDSLSDAAVQIFKDRGIDVTFDASIGKDKDKLLSVIHEYDGLAIRSASKVTEKIIAAATNLKVIGRAGIGVDNVDIPEASKKGIIVMNTPFGNSITTAEHAIAMMFAVARQIPEANASTHAGKWEKSRFMGVELTGKTLGVIGAGNIGSIVCDRARGLKMKVVAYDPFLSEERAKQMGVTKVELDDLLAQADFITFHVPYTEKTANILSAENLKKTKKGVRIINCARGGLVDEAALAELITAGHVAGAAFRRVRRRTGDGKPAVQPAQCRRHPASGRRHDRGAGKRRASGGRTDGRLPADGGGVERAEHAVGHRAGGRDHGAVAEACRTSGRFRGPADRRADPVHRGGL